MPLLFFFNDTATTEIYTLSLHDALPISRGHHAIWIQRLDEPRVLDRKRQRRAMSAQRRRASVSNELIEPRSEEHTSELQSHSDLVCRLLLEKKKKNSRDASIQIQLDTLI